MKELFNRLKKPKSDNILEVIPIIEIRDGNIKSANGTWSKTVEVFPVNYELRSKSEQESMILYLEELYKAAPFDMQILIQTRKADVDYYLKKMEQLNEGEANPALQELRNADNELIRKISKSTAVSRSFSITFNYDVVNINYTYEDVLKQFAEKTSLLKKYAFNCVGGIEVHDDNNYIMNKLYAMLNPKTSIEQPLSSNYMSLYYDSGKSIDPHAVDRLKKESKNDGAVNPMMSADAEQIVRNGMCDSFDIFLPSAIDVTNKEYLYVDGTYINSLVITGYPNKVKANWLSSIINFGEGVDLSIHIKKLDKSKVITDLTYNIGAASVNEKEAGENRRDIDEIRSAKQDARYMREEIAINNQELYNIFILIKISADNTEKLSRRTREVQAKLGAMDMLSKSCDFRQLQALQAFLPLCYLPKELFKLGAQNILTKGLASMYPFSSYELSDPDGVLMGINEQNESMIMIDIFNANIYKNANMVVLGTSGAGKTFLMQMLALRLRQHDIPVSIIAPLKAHEFKRACGAVNGQYIKIAPQSKDCINVLDLRLSSLSKGIDNSNESLLASKIPKLMIFFRLLYKEISDEEVQYLEDKIILCYEEKGITFDNESIYKTHDNHSKMIRLTRELKEMPILEDLYNLLCKDDKTKRLALLLKRLVSGSLKSFNGHTSIDVNNKYVVIDIGDLTPELLPLGMYIAIEMLWDKIKEDRTKKKAILIDEAWKLIGTDGNAQTAEFILEIFKTIRGYGGSAIAGTQDISDFFALDNGKYGRGIISNSNIKCLLQVEEHEAISLKDILKLSEGEMLKVISFERGHGLFYAGSNHVAINFKASDMMTRLITTDRAELEKIKMESEVKSYG